MNNLKPTILITGGAGFIGSNFIPYFIRKYPNCQLIVIDKLTYAGDKENLNGMENYSNYHFINGDIADEQRMNAVFADYNISGVIHFAAESHVDRSIEDARTFVESNVFGTTILLQVARNAWEKEGNLATKRFHHISTDEVYGSMDETGKFSEATPYDPRNPYSASKASANLLVKSFGHTYGMNVVISSSSNNYGPKQHSEKLIPTIISKALHLEPIPIYGDGQNIRDWLFVEDHCRALDLIYHKASPMESYVIGGHNEKTNISIAMKICSILDELKPDVKRNTSLNSFHELLSFTEDRKGHDRHYAIDDSKIRKTLGWEPEMPLEAGLLKTVKWYVDKWEKAPLSYQ